MSVQVEARTVEIPSEQTQKEALIPDELIQRAQEGDETAIEQTMELSIPIAFRTARRFGSQPEFVEDIAYSGLEKVYRNGLLRRLYEGGNFNKWINRTVQNTAIDILRKKQRIIMTPCEPTHTVIVNFTDNHDTAEQVELRNAAVNIRAIMELAGVVPAHANPYILHHVDGYSYEEISDMLGLNIGTVRSRISRTKNRLEQHKSELAEFLGFGPLSNAS